MNRKEKNDLNQYVITTTQDMRGLPMDSPKNPIYSSCGAFKKTNKESITHSRHSSDNESKQIHNSLAQRTQMINDAYVDKEYIKEASSPLANNTAKVCFHEKPISPSHDYDNITSSSIEVPIKKQTSCGILSNITNISSQNIGQLTQKNSEYNHPKSYSNADRFIDRTESFPNEHPKTNRNGSDSYPKSVLDQKNYRNSIEVSDNPDEIPNQINPIIDKYSKNNMEIANMQKRYGNSHGNLNPKKISETNTMILRKNKGWIPNENLEDGPDFTQINPNNPSILQHHKARKSVAVNGSDNLEYFSNDRNHIGNDIKLNDYFSKKREAHYTSHQDLRNDSSNADFALEKRTKKFSNDSSNQSENTTNYSSGILREESRDIKEKDEKINCLTNENLKLMNHIKELQKEIAYLDKEKNSSTRYYRGSVDNKFERFTKKKFTGNNDQMQDCQSIDIINSLKEKNNNLEMEIYDLKAKNESLEQKLNAVKNELYSIYNYYEDIITKLKSEVTKLKSQNPSACLEGVLEDKARGFFSVKSEDFVNYDTTFDAKRTTVTELNTPEGQALFRQLQEYQRSTKKFIDSITKMATECNYAGTSKESNNSPTLKQVWKWLKSIFQDYINLKRMQPSSNVDNNTQNRKISSSMNNILEEVDILNTLKEILSVSKKDLIIPCICDTIQNNIQMSKIISKFKLLLNLVHITSEDKLEESIDQMLSKRCK